MCKKISVIIKEPGKKPRHVYISNSINNLNKTVGGFIKSFKISSDIVAICNVDCLLLRHPWCCNISGFDLMGTIILAGTNGEYFSNLPITYQQAKILYPSLWG